MGLVLLTMTHLRLHPEDKQWLLDSMRAMLTPPHPPIPAPLHPQISRMTVRQFAVAVELHPDVVNLKVRVGDIPSKFVFGSRPRYIASAALAMFGVTADEARARLAERNLLQPSQPSQA